MITLASKHGSEMKIHAYRMLVHFFFLQVGQDLKANCPLEISNPPPNCKKLIQLIFALSEPSIHYLQ